MKRIALSMLVLMLMVGVCFASDTISKDVYSYGVKNTTGVAQTTIIPTTSIRPGVDKVIGYSVTPLNKNTAECYIGVFDGTDVLLTGEVFAENEAAQGAGVAELWEFGKSISLGVVLRQGANTQAQVYFVKE